MRRGFLLGVPAFVLASCAVALAQDPNAVPSPSALMSGSEYLLSFGPSGLLAWGAYLLGKGVRITVLVELSERDRQLLLQPRADRPA